MVAKIDAKKILVVMPNWLGDAVMATPFLAALRGIYPEAHIAALARPLAAPVLAGLSFVNETRLTPKSEKTSEVVRWIRGQKFDLAVLLPNSFRSAWMLRRAGIPHRLGYARDWRSPLLTGTIAPLHRTAEQRDLDERKSIAIRTISGELKNPASVKIGSKYQPVPTIDYYLKLAEHLMAAGGVGDFSRQMHLAITALEEAEGESALAQAGISPSDNLITIVPGANFGSSKCYPPERFAQVADRLMDKQGATNAHVILATSPSELPIAERILACSALCPGGKGMGRLHATAMLNEGKPLSIGALKQIIKRSQLLLCNDTGPRHFAAALGVPLVTLFGPTDPVWAETYSKNETILRAGAACSPCQLKKCPIDHRCMTEISVGTIFETISNILHPPAPPEPDIDPRTLEDLSTNF